MLETVKIRRAGFPVRRTFKDFFLRFVFLISSLSDVVDLTGFLCSNKLFPLFLCRRYKIIMKEKTPAIGDDKKRSTDLLFKYDKTKKEWQLGKTKVRSSICRHENCLLNYFYTSLDVLLLNS